MPETRQDYLCRHDIDHSWICDERKNMAFCSNCGKEMILDTAKPVKQDRMTKFLKRIRLLKW